MKCTVCKIGQTVPGHATVTLERDGKTIVIKAVPAEVCDNCGEEYVAEETTTNVLRQADSLVVGKDEVVVRPFAA